MNQTSFWEQSWKNLDPERVTALLESFDFSDDAILQTLRVRGTKTVCDAGCGCGVYALKLVRHGFFVSGFDLSEDAVAKTRRLLAENGVVHGDFRAADVLDTGYPDGQFDAVVARDVLDHMPIRSAVVALGELLRILRPGGCLLLSLDQTDEEYESEPHRVNADGDYLFSAGKWAGMVFHPYSPEEIDSLCCGRPVEVLPMEQGYLVIFEKDRPLRTNTEEAAAGGPDMNAELNFQEKLQTLYRCIFHDSGIATSQELNEKSGAQVVSEGWSEALHLFYAQFAKQKSFMKCLYDIKTPDETVIDGNVMIIAKERQSVCAYGIEIDTGNLIYLDNTNGVAEPCNMQAEDFILYLIALQCLEFCSCSGRIRNCLDTLKTKFNHNRITNHWDDGAVFYFDEGIIMVVIGNDALVSAKDDQSMENFEANRMFDVDYF